MCASGAKDKNGNKGQDTVAVNEANFKGSSEASLKRFAELRRFSSRARSGLVKASGRGANALTQRRYALRSSQMSWQWRLKFVTREQSGLTRDHLTL